MSTGKQVALILGIVGGGVVLAIACCAGFIYWGYQSSAEIASPRIDDFFAAAYSNFNCSAFFVENFAGGSVAEVFSRAVVQ